MENRPPFGRRFFPVLDYVFLALLVCGGIFLYAEGDRRADLRALGERVKRELAAVEKAVAAVGAPAGEPVPAERYLPHLEGGRRLKRGEDALGHAFGDQVGGQSPKVPAATAEALEEVADAEFWKPYRL